jgi:hypothetical protein
MSTDQKTDEIIIKENILKKRKEIEKEIEILNTKIKPDIIKEKFGLVGFVNKSISNKRTSLREYNKEIILKITEKEELLKVLLQSEKSLDRAIKIKKTSPEMLKEKKISKEENIWLIKQSNQTIKKLKNI